jgi:hypothetical protein
VPLSLTRSVHPFFVSVLGIRSRDFFDIAAAATQNRHVRRHNRAARMVRQGFRDVVAAYRACNSPR